MLTCLDLFCKAGGVGEGYRRAGFDVTGVDIDPQPNNPHRFIQADAFQYLAAHGHKYDLIHASPPCQRYSRATRSAGTQDNHPDLIPLIRDLLIASNKPYVIENVVGAPLKNPLLLNGMMFGLGTIRDRLFETNPPIYFKPIPYRKYKTTADMGRQPIVGEQYITCVGHFSNVEYGRKAMGIDWYMTQGETAEAIPPAFTEYIGKWFMQYVFQEVNA